MRKMEQLFINHNTGYYVRSYGATLLSELEASLYLTKQEREYKEMWWLRTKKGSKKAAMVHETGYIGGYCMVDYNGCVVRPAILVDADDVADGEILEDANSEYKVIGDYLPEDEDGLNFKLAFIKDKDIGKCAYNYNRDKQKDAKYEDSDVKKYIDDWYHNM
jgi:hypothetical protein